MSFPLCAQTSRFRMMEYNVENLFDYQHDSLKNDEDFLPDGKNRWTYRKYWEKLVKISKVIVAVGGEQLPDLVALCEVENDRVLRDLTNYSPLRVAGYDYVMTDSPDERGIDVALLYQRGRFKLLSSQSYRLPSNPKNGKATRDILHATGLMITQDTLDVFVCHFPSRASGERMTRTYRQQIASRLRAICDSIMAMRTEAHIIITGDFNDEPSNDSMRKGIGTFSLNDVIDPDALYNLMENKTSGTYRYKGEWYLFDQVIVSGRLLQKGKAIFTSEADAMIIQYPFLLEDDRTYGGKKPFRMQIGPRYNGGFSDHLPICVDFWIQNR